MLIFFKFSLRQKSFVNKDYYVNTSLCNIFKTVNAMTFTKINLENPYKVIQKAIKKNCPKGVCIFVMGCSIFSCF